MTEEQLEQVTEFAKLQFTPVDIATIMGLPDEFIREALATDGPVKTAYDKGLLIAESELRKTILTMAKQGSSPAQKQFMEIVFRRIRDNEAIKRKL